MANCNLPRPTAQELWDKNATQFAADVLGGASIIPESNEYYIVALNMAVEQEFYSVADTMWKETDPRTACCENLTKMAAINGVYPKSATYSQGYIKIDGVEGSALSQTMEITFGENKYVPAGAVPATIGTAGYAIVRIRAENPGAAANIASGQTGTITNPPAGVNATVSLYGSFCSGAPGEDCEAFRTRYLDRLSYKPNATLEFIKDKILEWPCVTDVCDRGDACCEIDENSNVICQTTFSVYAMFRNTFPCGLAPQCVLDELNIYLNGEKPGYGMGVLPFGICGRAVIVTGAYVDITIDGAACATEAQRQEIEKRIKDFVSLTCPSENLYLRQIDLIVTQVMGNVSDLFISITKVNDPANGKPSDGINVDQCSDIIVDCGYKVCLNSLKFSNTNLSVGGCL